MAEVAQVDIVPEGVEEVVEVDEFVPSLLVNILREDGESCNYQVIASSWNPDSTRCRRQDGVYPNSGRLFAKPFPIRAH